MNNGKRPRGVSPVAALALAVAVTASIATAVGCGGPLGPIRGGRLAGATVATPVADWSFAESYPLMQIEVRPEDPYSVNVNFIVADGRLYVDIGRPEDWNRWRRLIRDDPRARVRFGDRVYPVLAEPVTATDEITAVTAAWEARRGKPPPADATFVRLVSAPVERGVPGDPPRPETVRGPA